jgi:hypothetical protein
MAAVGEALDVVDVATGSTRDFGEAKRFRWSPRGRALALSSSDGIELLVADGRTRLVALRRGIRSELGVGAENAGAP